MSILNGDSSAMKRMFKWIGIVFGSLLLSTILVLGIAYYHKAEILAAVNNELKKNVNGDIHIADIDFTLLEDFPAFSITLKDIYIRPSNYRIYKTDFLHAEKLSLDVRITSFLQKKIVIRSVKIVAGEIFAFRSRTGATNLDIFKKKEQRDTTSRNPASCIHAAQSAPVKSEPAGVHNSILRLASRPAASARRSSEISVS